MVPEHSTQEVVSTPDIQYHLGHGGPDGHTKMNESCIDLDIQDFKKLG